MGWLCKNVLLLWLADVRNSRKIGRRQQTSAHISPHQQTFRWAAAPPTVAAAASNRQDPIGGDSFLTWEYGPLHVRFERPGAYASNALPLRLTNRQLDSETRSVISRLDDKARHYNLGVLVVDERDLWSTWTCVPTSTNRIDRVDVTFRIFGNRRLQYSSFLPGDGSPPQIYWCFYYLLESFLKCGPVVSLTAGEEDREISVKMLTLNFVAGEGQQVLQEEDQALWWRAQSRYLTVDPEDTRIMRPSWLAETASSGLYHLLAMDYHSAKHGAILYERIGAIGGR